MPNIVQKYNFTGLSSDNLYKNCLAIFSEMGVTNIQQSNVLDNPSIKVITGVAPSV